ncbi:MAG: UDP-N-acetylmuramoyl-L-alanyl-D-glutamate--2,6-diaminopimelate ligase [Ruminococcaceae bacterium]|nr:UDP-N-acetylmuramoyl-L-alanyl-D-glutamate--2,6-diaminopimelate ligase [Oscillospiraceae bacterium]
MELKKLLQDVNLKEINVDLNVEIEGITQDSRSIKKGYAFVALKGAHIDGNKYIPSAINNGASLIVTEEKPEEDCPYIIVDNPRQALSQMLSNFYSRPQDSFKFKVGVTGTNGKTSTSVMLKNIFEAAGYKVGLIGTMKYLIGDEEYNSESQGNLLTTPDSENFWSLLNLMREKGVEVLVMEVSSHALALDKIYSMRFNVGIFTNLTRDHMDFHHDFENYLEAKAKLFSMCDTGIINEDDPYFEKLKEMSLCPVKTYSIDKDVSDFTAKNVRYKGALGVEYELLTNSLIFRIRVDIPGTFTVYNSLAAASVALTVGLGYDTIINGFKKTHRIEGRIDRVNIDAPYSVIIDFAHTPDAMENVISTVKGFAKGRIITLFGCGGDRDKTKRPIMGKISTEMSDYVIITSDNSRSENKDEIIRDIISGIEKDNFEAIADRSEAIHKAMDIAEEDDVILCLGKGHEEYEIDEFGKHRFSERETVIEYYNRKRG